MTKQQLLIKLNECWQRSQWTIEKKTLRHPFKVVFPKALEKLESNFPIVTKTFWGGKLRVVLPEVVSTHLYRWGFFDREVCFYMIDSLNEGDTFIDIGSHFGSFSLLASKLVGNTGRVVSIDPTPSTYALMCSNMDSFASHRNFLTQNIALYDKEGKSTFYDFGVSQSAYNSIIGSRDDISKNADQFKIEIQTETLDSLVKRLNLLRVDFLKIDAESAELAIIKGGREALTRFSPRVTVEVGDVGLPNAPLTIEIIREFESLGYTPFEFDGTRLKEHVIRSNYEKNSLSCYNLLFIKK